MPIHEIFVVDNRSDDDSIGILRTRLKGISNVRVLENRTNAGYAGGNNLAFRHIRSDFVLVTNPDNELAPDGLAQMAATLHNEPDVGIVAPKLIHEDDSIRTSVRRFPSPADVIAKRAGLERLFSGRVQKYLGTDADPHTPRDVDWAVGACLLIRREVLEQLGGFDDRFFLFFEDMDFCRRAWEAGWRVVYRPVAIARDRKRRLSDGSLITLMTKKVGRAHVTSAIKYFWKWHGKSLPKK